MIGVLLGVPSKLKTLLDRMTAGRATNLDNLDVPVSSRAPAATALSTDVWTQTHADAILAGGGGNSKCQEFGVGANFTFNVPAGVSLVWVTLQAPGGGSGQFGTGGGGGGAGELIRRYPYAVTPGGTVAGTLAAAGTANGPNATFGTLTAQGGRGGNSNNNGNAGGGPLGGSAAPNTSGSAGSVQGEVIGGAGGGGAATGHDGGPCGTNAGGNNASNSGGGGASYFSPGGAANDSAQPAVPGIGAGAGGTLSGTRQRGGHGYCMVEWIG